MKLGFRQVNDFPPLKMKCLESQVCKNPITSRLGPITLNHEFSPSEVQANVEMFMDVFTKTQLHENHLIDEPELITREETIESTDTDAFSSIESTNVAISMMDEDIIDIDEQGLLDEIEKELYDTEDEKQSPINDSEIYYSAFHSIKSSNYRSGWIIDSGASIHMSYDKSIFHDINLNHFGHVVVADGNKIKILGKGTVIVTVNAKSCPTTIRLENVAFVPDLSCNLLSVILLNMNRNSQSVIFDENTVSIKINSQITPIGLWKLNAYVLDEFAKFAPCVHEWHRRISHRNIADIKKAANRLGIKITRCACSDDCDSCMRAKQSNQPFKNIATKPKSRLDIVVSDLSGPYPLSHAGSRWYMTMIDLATDYTEVWCLRHKNEAAKAIKQYITKQENLLNDRLKVFRTDKGTEYCNNELIEYFADKGIIHQTTCAESPE